MGESDKIDVSARPLYLATHCLVPGIWYFVADVNMKLLIT